MLIHKMCILRGLLHMESRRFHPHMFSTSQWNLTSLLWTQDCCRLNLEYLQQLMQVVQRTLYPQQTILDLKGAAHASSRARPMRTPTICALRGDSQSRHNSRTRPRLRHSWRGSGMGSRRGQTCRSGHAKTVSSDSSENCWAPTPPTPTRSSSAKSPRASS